MEDDKPFCRISFRINFYDFFRWKVKTLSFKNHKPKIFYQQKFKYIFSFVILIQLMFLKFLFIYTHRQCVRYTLNLWHRSNLLHCRNKRINDRQNVVYFLNTRINLQNLRTAYLFSTSAEKKNYPRDFCANQMLVCFKRTHSYHYSDDSISLMAKWKQTFQLLNMVETKSQALI